MIHPNDVARWQAKLDQVEVAAQADTEVQAHWARLDELRPLRDAEARAFLDDFFATGDFAAFRAASDAWTKHEGPYESFRGFGQMWLNQVAKNLPTAHPSIIPVLQDALKTPVDPEAAVRKFKDVEDVTRDLASKGQPAVGRIPYVLSLFWSTDPDDTSWPCMWASAPERMYELGWLRSWDNVERYLAFRETAHMLFPGKEDQLERLMWFLTARQAFVGLNPSLPDMCDEAAQILSTHQPGVGYLSEADEDRAGSLAAQLKGELHLAMTGLLPAVVESCGLDLEKSELGLRTSFDSKAPYRADSYATWTAPGGMSSPGYRLWATRSGLALGVHGGWGSDVDATKERARRLKDLLPSGATFFKVRPHSSGDRLQPVDDYSSGDVFAGFWWGWEEVPQARELRVNILDGVRAFAPVMSALSATLEESGATIPTSSQSQQDMIDSVARFKAERPYPNEKDEWNAEQRKVFAEALSAENLSVFDLDLFRLLINGKRYGHPGPQAVLNGSLSAMDSLELDKFAARIREILWGEGDEAHRIDRALDREDLGVRGLGESVILKMFSIIRPERFLPIFPLGGASGKLAMLKRLDLPLPDESLSRGQQHVVANDTLRSHLEPLLPDDPWGQAQFTYWLLTQDEGESAHEEDRIKKAAADLLVPETFLRELEDLLSEKRQLIFYGPPGTGKTYLAQEFAAAIQPDPERRRLVQFHPSMSYEDFFEGYRPQTDERGQLSYVLRHGPLALLAEKADASPGIPHVMIIDEINRANLPRVFGELLFLLEYRNKAVRTAYRPDEPFELPKNLYFIGTMNTADRSISMVDAALRRRFHFIPFMPHEGAMESVLRSWLKKYDEPLWVANLVGRVNEELRTVLRGPHLQIGHSYFMGHRKPAESGVAALSDQRLERIWTYDIYPFIEDQLYGKPDQLEAFTWSKVYARYGPTTDSGIEAEQELQSQVAETEADAAGH